MSKRCRSACVALILAVVATPAVSAKPPGPTEEGILTSAPLDTITPCVFFAGRLCQQPAPASSCPYLQKLPQARPIHPPQIDVNDALTNLGKLSKARRLYQAGERCRLGGDRELAAQYYEEAHLACPTCRYGLQAMERLSQMDAGWAVAAAEEQETPDGTRFDWGEVIRLLGCCADVSFGAATRFQCEIPLGVVRVRVEYNSQHDSDPTVRVRVP